jgi:branched-chain amino acid transport system substrate-binding protein
MRNNKLLILMMVVMLVAIGLAVGACGSDTETTETTAAGTDTTAAGTETTAAGTDTTAAPATGEPIKIGFNEGLTGFMATDAQIADQGIQTALAMVDNQVLGRPIEYIKADNASDPVQAVDKARKLVEEDKIDMTMTIFSPAVRAISDYLAKSTGIPQVGINPMPMTTLETANNLLFIPSGILNLGGYLLGKYATDVLGYKTATCIHYDDLPAYDYQAAFEKGFAEGGGKVLGVQYVPIDTIDFSPYLTAMEEADMCLWWIFGNGAVPFIKQYNDYGQKAMLISPMAQNVTEGQMLELGDLGVGLLGFDYYSPEIDSELNKAFVAKYREMWKGESPAPQAFSAWLAVNLFLEGVKKTNGDTTPAKIIEAMSTMSYETPAGLYTMAPYQDSFIGTGNCYVLKTKDVGDGRIAWVPEYTYEQVLFESK